MRVFLCRILVFSPTWISSVKVQVDNIYLGEAQHSNGPLYVLEWEPFHYLGGLHTIMVQAVVRIMAFILGCVLITDLTSPHVTSYQLTSFHSCLHAGVGTVPLPGWSAYNHGPSRGTFYDVYFWVCYFIPLCMLT